MKTFHNFIGGAWVAPSTGAYFENRNPADQQDVIGRFMGEERPLRFIDAEKPGFFKRLFGGR